MFHAIDRLMRFIKYGQDGPGGSWLAFQNACFVVNKVVIHEARSTQNVGRSFTTGQCLELAESPCLLMSAIPPRAFSIGAKGVGSSCYDTGAD